MEKTMVPHPRSTLYRGVSGHLITINPETMETGPTGMGLKLITEHETDCQICGEHFDAYDGTAIHLVDEHHWDTHFTGLWLRSKVEKEAFNDPE